MTDKPAIGHPDKVLFPADGITKGELADYYDAVASVMLPHLSQRPLTMERYPAGIASKGFIQKDVSKGFPDWLERIEIPKRNGTVWYPLVNDVRALLWTANQNSITPHVWTSRLPELTRPDLLLFDLDPSREDAAALRRAALQLRDLLAELGLPSFPKTSGSKGFHIVVPLDRADDFELASRVAHGVAAVLVERDPTRLTQEFLKVDRAGRLFLDVGRNAPGATFAAAYAVRARAGAPVSAPCTWDELERGQVEPQSFALRSMRERLAAVGDLWAPLLRQGHSLRQPLERLRRLLSEEQWQLARKASRRKPAPRKPTQARRSKP
jgi:bifunctional non-homologous end joining protein LigD